MPFFQNFIQHTQHLILNRFYAEIQRHFSANKHLLDQPNDPSIPSEQEAQKTSPSSSPRSVAVEEEVLVSSVKRTVTFEETVSVVPVTTRKEYRRAGLTNTLWFQPDDYTTFRKEAAKEVSDCMKNNKITGPEAIHLLFQPNDSDRSECHSEPSSALPGTFSR